MEKSKILLLNGIKVTRRAIVTFLSPVVFWPVYLCYFFLFMHGLMSSSGIDRPIIRIDMPASYSSIWGLSFTTVAALILYILTAFLGIRSYREKKYLISFLTVLHLIIVFIWAGYIAEWGHLILWGAIRD